MLILTRRIGESILINNDIEVIVLDLTYGKYAQQVRIGIVAPSEVPILRKELLARDDLAKLLDL